MDFITDSQTRKNEIMQLRPTELKLISEIKSPKETAESNKCSYLKGARKTLSSAKKINSQVEITKPKSTNINETPNKINAALEYPPNIYMHFPLTASTSNTSFVILGNSTAMSATRTLSAVTNNDNDIKKEIYSESIQGKKLDRNLLPQTKSKSLESERNVSRKRLLDKGTLNTDSQKTFVNNLSLVGKYQCEKSDRNPHFSSDGRSIGNNTLSKTGYLNQRFNSTQSLPLQSSGKHHQDINNIVGNKLLQNIPNSKRISDIKTVRFLDKISDNSCKTQLHEGNAVRPNLIQRQIPQTFVSENTNNSPPLIHGDTLQENIFKCYPNKITLPVTNAENMNIAQIPHTSLKIRNLSSIYPFQANSWQKSIAGTATRNSDQNIRMIFPQQLEKQYNLVNATAGPMIISRPPFAVSRAAVEALGNNKLNKIVNRLDTILASENNRKNYKSANQTFTESDQANPDERSTDLHIFNNSSNGQNSAEKTRASDIKSTVGRINDQEVGSEGKIQATNKLLSMLSELLQNINDDLLCGIECPGLELSLPIWRAELEQCILSVEKIKTVITKYQDQNT